MQYIFKPESYYNNAESRLSTHACFIPFRSIEINTQGEVTICCQTWLPTEIGNLLTQTAQEVLDSADLKRVQDNMRQGNFSDCNDRCPFISSFLLRVNMDREQNRITPIDQLENRITREPIIVYLSYDRSCNLQCPSCRTNLVVWDPDSIEGKQSAIIHNNTKELIRLLIERNPNTKIILNITGSGDPFASSLFWGYLIELSQTTLPKNLRIMFQTNGILMTKENWKLIKPLWPYIHQVCVSVDAATEKTYNIVRKNGNFKKLKKNLVVLDNMITANCFPNLILWQSNMVVQKANYRELKLFVEWMLSFKSRPKVWTNLIAQWDHISNENFKTMAIWQDNNPNKEELIDILKDPIFINPRVQLGTLSLFLPKNSAK